MLVRSSLIWIVGMALTLGNCSKDKSNDAPEATPQPLPTPTPSPAPREIIKEAQPEPGYSIAELLESGKYCTVNRPNVAEKFLIEQVDQQRNVFSLSYYFMEEGKLKASSQIPAGLFEINCDVQKLNDSDPIILLQSTVHIYADKSFSEDPICTFPAGYTQSSYDWFYEDINGLQALNIPLADCKGHNRGFINGDRPASIQLYPGPA